MKICFFNINAVHLIRELRPRKQGILFYCLANVFSNTKYQSDQQYLLHLK